MENNPKDKEFVQRVLKVFLVADDRGKFMTLDNETDKLLNEPTKSIFLNLVENLQSVTHTLSIPFNLVSDRVYSQRMDRFYTAERIRARDDDLASTEELFARAHKRFDEWYDVEGRDAIPDEILIILESMTNNEKAMIGARDLVRQGLVMTWSAFEVFFREAIEHVINNNTKNFLKIYNNKELRRQFIPNSLDWEVLSDFEFDMREKLGEYIVSRSDLSSIAAIRKIAGAIWDDSSEIASKLSENRLWLLNQKRNLIVHRRGIVDRKYLAATGDDVRLGEILLIVPQDVEAAQEAVYDACNAVAKEVQRAIMR